MQSISEAYSLPPPYLHFRLLSVLWSCLSLSSMQTCVCIHLGGVGLKSCNPLSPFSGCKKICSFQLELNSVHWNLLLSMKTIWALFLFHVLSVPLVTCVRVRGTVLSLNYEMLGSSPLKCLSVFKTLLRNLLALGLFPTRS